ncbi:SMP-30/gluconolactonase/LRE family protein [Novosphingobium sp. M1R2S20]|uniref:SMP-30/gluconolactonase/LRE family protein n=1 Tax=Novosphingobium rhizovicinum TaxID=3228928 RepID=A0ABV3R705_9SPHN
MDVSEPQVRRIGATQDAIGETPVWREDERALYWIDCEGPCLRRWLSDTGEVSQWPMPERIGGFVFKQDGGALITLSSGIFDFDFDSGTLTLRVASPLGEEASLHECACDPAGRLWVGSIDHRVGHSNLHPGGAKLFRLDGNKLTPVIENFSCANGLAFSPKGDALYISDSTTLRCDRYALDPVSGHLGERSTLFKLGPGDGFVDGAAVDAEGGYWAALVYAGKLRRYLPDGTADIEIRLPFANPTKLAFGGADMRTMYITTIHHGLDGKPPTPLDGGLYAIEAPVAGRPDPAFAGSANAHP